MKSSTNNLLFRLIDFDQPSNLFEFIAPLCKKRYQLITFGKLDRCNPILADAPEGSLENVESSLSYE